MTSPGGSTDVDPDALDRIGDRLSEVGSFLRRQLDRLAATAARAAPATGGSDAQQAYEEMWHAWDRDLGTLAAATDEMSGHVHRAAAAYRATHKAVTRSIRGPR